MNKCCNASDSQRKIYKIEVEAVYYVAPGITHDVLYLYFNCKSCGAKGTVTAEIESAGKKFRYGKYPEKCLLLIKDCKNVNCSVKDAKEVFNDMDGDYDLITNNCKTFSREMFDELE